MFFFTPLLHCVYYVGLMYRIDMRVIHFDGFSLFSMFLYIYHEPMVFVLD